MKRPTDKEIQAMIDAAQDSTQNLFGMSYQEGVVAALMWALGNTDELPIESN